MACCGQSYRKKFAKTFSQPLANSAPQVNQVSSPPNPGSGEFESARIRRVPAYLGKRRVIPVVQTSVDVPQEEIETTSKPVEPVE